MRYQNVIYFNSVDSWECEINSNARLLYLYGGKAKGYDLMPIVIQSPGTYAWLKDMHEISPTPNAIEMIEMPKSHSVLNKQHSRENTLWTVWRRECGSLSLGTRFTWPA